MITGQQIVIPYAEGSEQHRAWILGATEADHEASVLFPALTTAALETLAEEMEARLKRGGLEPLEEGRIYTLAWQAVQELHDRDPEAEGPILW